MEPAQATLLQEEIENVATTARRRLEIGNILAEMGDSRPGVAVKGGVPDIAWLPVAPGGEIMIPRHWRPDAPGETEKFIHKGPFHVEPFYIAKYLVTLAQYQAFIDAGDGHGKLIWWQGMPVTYQRQKLAEQQSILANRPRDTISWYQAVAFARWLNHRLQGFELPHPTGQGVMEVEKNAQVRLPTEWEWQWAAQNGVEERPYPWGNFRPNFANTAELGLKQSTAVGMFPQGGAACGALDMAGNLMEWCLNDKADPTIIDVGSTATKVLRGGDWGYNSDNATTRYCDDEKPNALDPLNGFRLVLGSILQNE